MKGIKISFYVLKKSAWLIRYSRRKIFDIVTQPEGEDFGEILFHMQA
jgi:hypothetical protein